MTKTLTDVTGGEVVAAALAAHGVDVVFGIPGTHNLSIFDAMARSGIKVVATTHEQGAGYAADGYARTSRRAGVAVVTSGPAVFNASTAVAQAYSDSSPVLLISPGMRSDHPEVSTGTGYLHEAKDQQRAMDAIVERSVRVHSHQEIADEVAAAFDLFTHRRPRPVHLEVPLDLLEARGSATVARLEKARGDATPSSGLSEAVAHLLGSNRPVIVAGGGSVGAGAEVTAVAELLSAPVITTINGKGVMGEHHPLSWGARLHLPEAVTALRAADLLLVVGSELGQSDVWFGPVPDEPTVVRIDIDAAMRDVNVASDVMLVGDARHVLRQLFDELNGRSADMENRATDPERVAKTAEQLDAASELEGARWVPWLRAIDQAADDDVVYATDNAMCVYYGAVANLPVGRPGSFHFPTGFGTLGFTVPVAVGSALAAPDRQTIGITGDGGLLFTVTELAVAAAEQLAVAIVVFDNSGYGEIRAEMVDRGETPTAVEAPPRDLVLLGRALGAHAVSVASPADLTEALLAAKERQGPSLLVVAEPEQPRKDPR
jgi:thiamine pyrophosphate-dependent acetolactate synthase large subunit-like protein